MAEMNRRSKMLKKFETGKMPKVAWLDKLSLEEIKRISEVFFIFHYSFFLPICCPRLT